MDTRELLQFIRLGRFRFLLSGFIPFSAGALLALLLGARFTPAQFLLGYAAMAAAHLSVHYSNDYFDADADRFVEPTAISGGSGVLVENPGLKPAALRAAVALMFVSVLIGYLLSPSTPTLPSSSPSPSQATSSGGSTRRPRSRSRTGNSVRSRT